MRTSNRSDGRADLIDFPQGSWYAVAPSTAVGRAPLATRVLDHDVVLYRDTRGDTVALDDRCCHSSYPLSLGRLEGDSLRCGYSGFRYGPDGVVTSVPTQDQVPVGAAVRAFPVREQDGFIWLWPGTPGRAALRPIPALPWLTSPEWTTFGDTSIVQAHASLLQDNFADITHISHLHPAVAPPVLASAPPPLVVTVSELAVSFTRDYPASVLQPWHAEVLELPADATHTQHEQGQFLSPGVWVDRWDIDVDGHGDADGVKTLYFTHAITPLDDRTTSHTWRVSRNFTPSAAATGTMQPLLSDYYRTVATALETIQRVIDRHGPRREVAVAADAAKAAVQKLMARLAAEDDGGR